jgi:hypothetical protein
MTQKSQNGITQKILFGPIVITQKKINQTDKNQSDITDSKNILDSTGITQKGKTRKKRLR